MKSHTTAQCKKWVPGGKSHDEWRGVKTANINVHQGLDVNQLIAQQTKFNKKIMKQMKSLESKKKKSKRRRRYSDSESSDSDRNVGSDYSNYSIYSSKEFDNKSNKHKRTKVNENPLYQLM